MLSLKTWRPDFQASLVVFLVALPLCLGIALASNAPLSAGLFAGIIGGIVVGCLSSSPISVSGPAAGLTVIVINSIQALGTFEVFAVAVFLSGLFQLLFGLLRGGAISEFFPTSVIKGMLAAIGLILLLKQIPHAVGYDVNFMGDESFNQLDGQNTFSEILLAFSRLHGGAIIITLLSLGIMMYWEKAAQRGKSFFKLVPGALVAVLCGILLNEIFHGASSGLGLDARHLVQLPFNGGLGDFVASMRFPDWSNLGNVKVYQVALTIAIVGSLESLLSVAAADKMDPNATPTSKNRELIAQGVGNTLSGLVGGLPLTAVIVRTTANVTAGARSGLSAVLHGLWLFLCVVTIPQLLNKIPLAALAAVLLMVGYKLAKPSLFRQMYQKGMNQFVPFIATVAAILFTDLLVGIMFGIVVGFIFVIRSNAYKAVVLVKDGDLVLIRFYKDVSFLQKATMHKMFNEMPDGSHVLIDGSGGVFIDNDIEELIEDFIRSSTDRNITVTLQKSSLALNNLFKE